MNNSIPNFPRHLAVIMDGNGRWAKRRLLPRIYGHRRGVEAARKLIQGCVTQKIQALTLFAFSSENWNRPKAEVKLLMSLLNGLLKDEIYELHSQNVRLRVIGDIGLLNDNLQASIYTAQALTEKNTGLQLNIAINYGGRWDIIQATRKIAHLVQEGKLDIENISEDAFSKYLSLHDIGDPELLIRTSGEQRLSNFLLWQSAYTEIFFTNTLWPDFAEQDLQQALEFYAHRQRRFGCIVEEQEMQQKAIEYAHA